MPTNTRTPQRRGLGRTLADINAGTQLTVFGAALPAHERALADARTKIAELEAELTASRRKVRALEATVEEQAEQIRKDGHALAYYRPKSFRPVREQSRETMLADMALGARNDSRLKTIGRLEHKTGETTSVITVI